MTRLGDYISEFSVKNHLDESIPVYSVTNDRGFCSGYFNKDVASKDKTTYKIVPRGYFAYNPSRINVGSIAWQNSAERVIVSPLYVVFKVSDKLDRQYLLHYLKSDVGMTFIKAHAAGSVRDSLKFSDLKELPIHVVPLEKQRKIARTLDKLDALISQCHQQANSFDTLVKSRFVEMFGDPVSNPHRFEQVALSQLAEIKIGPFGSLLHKEDYIEGGHPLLNPSHISEGRIVPDDKLTVSDSKYAEMEAYHLHTGDIVMGRRGEMGRCAVVPDEGYLCGTGSLLIRTKGEVTADYLEKVISFPTFKKTIEDMAVGQTMPNLNVPIVSSFQIIKPPIDVQRRYYAFVAEADKSKLAVKQSLEKLETLKKSLMQQYFG